MPTTSVYESLMALWKWPILPLFKTSPYFEYWGFFDPLFAYNNYRDMFLVLWNSSSELIIFPCYDLSKKTTFCHNLHHILTISSRSLMPNTIVFTAIFLYYTLYKMAHTLVIFLIFFFFRGVLFLQLCYSGVYFCRFLTLWNLAQTLAIFPY